MGAGLAEELVGQAGFGALDEGPDLVGFQDEGRAVGVGGLAQGDAAAGQFPGFQTVATVGAAPWLAPAVRAELCRAHAVMDVHWVRSPYGCHGGYSRFALQLRPVY